MNEVNEIEINFQIFQQTGLNTGGVWKVVEVFKNDKNVLESLKNKIREFELYDNKENYVKYFKQEFGFERYNTSNLELVKQNNWELFFKSRVKHWSEFELISKEENKTKFDKEEFENQKSKFTELLKNYLNKFQLKNVYKIDENKFDTSKTEWGDQISEDIIFELESRFLIIHFGWSS